MEYGHSDIPIITHLYNLTKKLPDREKLDRIINAFDQSIPFFSDGSLSSVARNIGIYPFIESVDVSIYKLLYYILTHTKEKVITPNGKKILLTQLLLLPIYLYLEYGYKNDNNVFDNDHYFMRLQPSIEKISKLNLVPPDLSNIESDIIFK